MRAVKFNVDGITYLLTEVGEVTNLNTGKKLKGWVDNTGYRSFSFKGKTERQTLHRLLAKAFIPNPQNLLEVNHIDGNKLNNSLSNLEWVSPVENIRHAFTIGLTSSKPIVDYATIPELLKRFYNGTPLVDLAKELGHENSSSLRKLLKRHTQRIGESEKFNLACEKGCKTRTKRQSKPVRNSIGEAFNSLAEAGKAYSCSPAAIYKAIHRQRPYKGTEWMYA